MTCIRGLPAIELDDPRFWEHVRYSPSVGYEFRLTETKRL